MAEASKEIRSLGRDSKRVVMPRREGYCGYTASSCTCLPVWGVGGSWCRACLHSRLPSRCSLRTKWEGEVPGLRPCLPLLRPHELRALHQALLLRIVTVVSCRGKTHNNRPYLSVENSNLLQKPLFWLDLHSSVTKSRSLLSFCSA